MIHLRLSRELSLTLRFVRFVRFEVPRFGGFVRIGTPPFDTGLLGFVRFVGFVRIGTPPFDTGLLDAPVVQAADAESGAPARLPVSPAAVVISRNQSYSVVLSRTQSYSVVISRNQS